MATRVLLDAGHGGWDNGATFMGRKEKEDNLNLTLAVGEILEQNGIDVVFSRTEDIYQSPAEKARLGNQKNADFFVSIHRNSGAEANQCSGVQTLIYNEGDIKEVLANNINERLAEVGFNNIGTEVRKELAVLRGTKMPAVLVEAGFINSDIDNAIWDENFDAIANAIAQGIVETLNMEERDKRFYRIQVGLFQNPENASRLANEIREMGYTVEVEQIGKYYAVLVGKFNDFSRAKRIERVLRKDGYDTLVILY